MPQVWLCTLPLGKRGNGLIVLLGYKLQWFMRWMCIYVLDMLIWFQRQISQLIGTLQREFVETDGQCKYRMQPCMFVISHGAWLHAQKLRFLQINLEALQFQEMPTAVCHGFTGQVAVIDPLAQLLLLHFVLRIPMMGVWTPCITTIEQWKKPGSWVYIGDYTTQLYRDHNKPWSGSLLTN